MARLALPQEHTTYDELYIAAYPAKNSLAGPVPFLPLALFLTFGCSNQPRARRPLGTHYLYCGLWVVPELAIYDILDFRVSLVSFALVLA